MRTFLCLILVCLVVCGCAGAVSLSSINGLVETPQAVHERVLENINVEVYENDLDLDIGISSLAISDNGEVAIIGKSSKADCDFIICVYASNGDFQYGFKINYDVLRGNTLLFYSEDGRLSYLCCYREELDGRIKYPSVVVTFSRTGITGSYLLENQDEFIVENLAMQGTTKVYISPHSEYGLSRIDDVYVSIVNLRTGEVQVVYDQTVEHEKFSKAMSKDGLSVWFFSTGIIGILLLFIKNYRIE